MLATVSRSWANKKRRLATLALRKQEEVVQRLLLLVKAEVELEQVPLQVLPEFNHRSRSSKLMDNIKVQECICLT